MRYIILDWIRKKYCRVSVKIPDKTLPGGLICRSLEYILQGGIDLKREWSYEAGFKKYERDHLVKSNGKKTNLN